MVSGWRASEAGRPPNHLTTLAQPKGRYAEAEPHDPTDPTDPRSSPDLRRLGSKTFGVDGSGERFWVWGT